jgi:hypothetical protein
MASVLFARVPRLHTPGLAWRAPGLLLLCLGASACTASETGGTGGTGSTGGGGAAAGNGGSAGTGGLGGGGSEGGCGGAGAPPARGEIYIVAPAGSPTNAGTEASPWDRESVFAPDNPHGLQCGDVVEFRDGVYDGPVRAYGTGCQGNPITFQNYPGETAIFDSSTFLELPGADSPSAHLTLDATTSYLRVRSNPAGGRFVIANSNPQRMFSLAQVTPTDPEFCYPSCRPNGVADLGDYNEILNVEIADVGIGIASQASACGSRYAGNIIRHVGWESPNSGYGEGFYAQNEGPPCTAPKTIEANVVFGSFAVAAQLYGSSGSFVQNLSFRDNVIFNNGQTSTDNEGGALLIGGIGTSVVADDVIAGNIMLSTVAGFTRQDILSFYVNPCVDCTVRDNYIYVRPGAGDAVAVPNPLPGLIETGNVFVGPIDGDGDPFAGSTLLPAENVDRVWDVPSPDDPRRHVVVAVDGDGDGAVSWTPACRCGSIELREMMNYTVAAAEQSFACGAGAVSLSMAYDGPLLQPVGAIAEGCSPHCHAPTHTGPLVRVFLATSGGSRL